MVATIGSSEQTLRSDLNLLPGSRTLLLDLQQGDAVAVAQDRRRPEPAHRLHFCVALVRQRTLTLGTYLSIHSI